MQKQILFPLLAMQKNMHNVPMKPGEYRTYTKYITLLNKLKFFHKRNHPNRNTFNSTQRERTRRIFEEIKEGFTF